ncbi:hypothetical protein [Fluviicola chungangensis]|uniref:Uncharacterized protein n=1 Tax=Fluviicola chungangensis TaxID=2597671 RepID=A0A556MZM9_9FLAO|nr:hypothetical protein [Fluviicola chungangensis]TSJ45382.1 hypothetical protein FO442_06420 [Fluviicola chungangensis]
MSLDYIHTDMLTLFTEISCISLALFFGILAFRKMDRFFRVLLLQVMVWSLFYACSHVITSYQHAHHLPINNQWLMNIHMLIETGILLAAAWCVLPKMLRTPLVIGAFSLFLLVFGVQGSGQGFGTYLNYADVTACIGITLVFSVVLYNFGQTTSTAFWKSPEKWACLGILLYFACSVPYVSMMNYLERTNPAINTFLYYLISGVLANVRYFLLALACWMIYRNTKKQTIHP